MKVKDLIIKLLNCPMENEIANIEGIAEPFFGQAYDTIYLQVKD